MFYLNTINHLLLNDFLKPSFKKNKKNFEADLKIRLLQ